MKKILITVISLVVLLSFTSCGSAEPVKVNVSNESELKSDSMCNFIEIGGSLVYDEATRIIYIELNTYAGNKVYTAYYAPNGLPYKYNLETNTLEEIEVK